MYITGEKKEVVYRELYEVIGVECDVCGKTINPVRYKEKRGKYFIVTTSHRDWGNDSCESVVCKDVCPGCICHFVTDYLKKCESTEEIEVETKYLYEGTTCEPD